MANAAERVYGLIKETVEAQGVSLWDVRFVKEGSSWYLRIFIDKPEGITIDDCTKVSHAVDPVIDEADPIDISYYLEVCSPGLERELTRAEHYEKLTGQQISIKLYSAKDGQRTFTGRLVSYGETVTIETAEGERAFTKKEISKANLCDFD